MTVLRIAMIVPEYHGDAGPGGGINTMAEMLAQDLSQGDGVHVEIISLRLSRRAQQSQRLLAPASWFRRPSITVRTIDGITVHDVGAWAAEIEVCRYWPRRGLTRLLQGFDVVLALAGGPAAAYAARDAGVPIVGYPASLVAVERAGTRAGAKGAPRVASRLMTWLVGGLERRGLAMSALTIAVNPTMRARYAELGAQRTALLAPGVDVHTFVPAAVRERSGPLLSVGRLSDPRKGVERLLEAYAGAVREEPSLPGLVLAGRTPPDERALQLVARLGLTERVNVISPVPTDALPALYSQASQFVMSSYEEGFGIVSTEAMAAGLPVVATSTAGSRYALGPEGQGGILVDVGSGAVPELQAAFVALHRDPERADELGRQAREYVVRTFSRKAESDRLVTLLSQVVEAAGRPDRRAQGLSR